MSHRYRPFRRGWSSFYCRDLTTGKQESLRTRDKTEAHRLVAARNESEQAPAFSLQLARVYWRAGEHAAANRTWQGLMNEVLKQKSGPTRERWAAAIKETALDASLDGILCWAVLMHLPTDRLFDTLFNLRRVLRPGGRLLISTPLQGLPSIEPNRDPDGRLFNEMPPKQFQFLFEKVGFRRTHRWDTGDTLRRSGRTWATRAFVLEGPGSRSLETIESILNVGACRI